MTTCFNQTVHLFPRWRTLHIPGILNFVTKLLGCRVAQISPHIVASALRLGNCSVCTEPLLYSRCTAGLDRVMQFYLQILTECYTCGSDRGPEQPAALCHTTQTSDKQLDQNIQQQWRQSTLDKAMRGTSFTATRCLGCKRR